MKLLAIIIIMASFYIKAYAQSNINADCINAIPLCISSTDKEEIIRFVKTIEPGFGAINIEDIESPKVFEIIKKYSNLIEPASIDEFYFDLSGMNYEKAKEA